MLSTQDALNSEHPPLKTLSTQGALVYRWSQLKTRLIQHPFDSGILELETLPTGNAAFQDQDSHHLSTSQPEPEPEPEPEPGPEPEPEPSPKDNRHGTPRGANAVSLQPRMTCQAYAHMALIMF